MRLLFITFAALFLSACFARTTQQQPQKVEVTDEELIAFWPAFKTFDRNMDARIDASEISYSMQHSVDFGGEEVEELIRAMSDSDSDGDLEITFPEFAKMMRASAIGEL
jgi:Ca2+-binding EF-hand superfamily protein